MQPARGCSVLEDSLQKHKRKRIRFCLFINGSANVRNLQMAKLHSEVLESKISKCRAIGRNWTTNKRTKKEQFVLKSQLSLTQEKLLKERKSWVIITKMFYFVRWGTSRWLGLLFVCLFFVFVCFVLSRTLDTCNCSVILCLPKLYLKPTKNSWPKRWWSYLVPAGTLNSWWLRRREGHNPGSWWERGSGSHTWHGWWLVVAQYISPLWSSFLGVNQWAPSKTKYVRGSVVACFRSRSLQEQVITAVSPQPYITLQLHRSRPHPACAGGVALRKHCSGLSRQLCYYFVLFEPNTGGGTWRRWGLMAVWQGGGHVAEGLPWGQAGGTGPHQACCPAGAPWGVPVGGGT